MKKILFLLVSVLFSASMMADDATQLNTDASDVLYITGTLQTGVKGNLYLMMKNTVAIGTTCAQFTLPTGVTISDDDVTAIAASVTSFAKQADGSYKLAYNHSFAVSSTAVVVATIPVTCTATPGSYNIVAAEYQMVKSDLTDIDVKNVYTTIKVQRAASIESLPDGYALEVIPFSPASGAGTLEFKYKAATDLLSIEFDVETPKGLMLIDASNSYAASIFSINTETCNNVPTASMSDQDAVTYKTTHVKILGGIVPPTMPKYVKAANSLTTLGTLAYYTDNTWGDAYALENGVQTLKIKNIKMQDYTSTTTYYEGNYQASVFVGTPTETDPIVYGHYTTAGQAALKAAATNFASVDMSAATVDATEDAVAADLAGILVYGPTKTSYNRTISTTYGTVCLPFALTSDSNTQYYQLKKVDGSNMVFEAVDNVAANTPAVFKGKDNIAASADGYHYASAPVDGVSVNGLTMKGTYTGTTLTSGYFIQNNTFYQTGSSTHVKPFRAYFSGSMSVKAMNIVLEDETGIYDVTDQLSNEDIYNLQGMKLNKTQKGVNIIGGKKYLVK